jgi:hypothetical protein
MRNYFARLEKLEQRLGHDSDKIDLAEILRIAIEERKKNPSPRRTIEETRAYVKRLKVEQGL